MDAKKYQVTKASMQKPLLLPPEAIEVDQWCVDGGWRERWRRGEKRSAVKEVLWGDN
jgi:hypothetical protein